VVLVETVGVGQSETLVAHMTDYLVALMLPAAGDELQGIKRGLLEVVDFLVFNKADGELRLACELAARQFRSALEAMAGGVAARTPEVFTCSATERTGILPVWEAIERRHVEERDSGELARRRQRQNLDWLWSIVEQRLQQAFYSDPQVQSQKAALEQEVVTGSLPVETAARRILHAWGIDLR
jgi:LAO/AO transport system kinase